MTSIHGTPPRPPKLTSPAAAAIARPTAIPSRTATLATKPRPYFTTVRIETRTTSATPRWRGAPYPGRLGDGAPAAQWIPTRIKEMPMTAMIVPVTTGGKSGRIRPIRGAARMPNRPAPMTPP